MLPAIQPRAAGLPARRQRMARGKPQIGASSVASTPSTTIQCHGWNSPIRRSPVRALLFVLWTMEGRLPLQRWRPALCSAAEEIVQLSSRSYEAGDLAAVQELYHSNG